MQMYMWLAYPIFKSSYHKLYSNIAMLHMYLYANKRYLAIQINLHYYDICGNTQLKHVSVGFKKAPAFIKRFVNFVSKFYMPRQK